MLKPTFQPFNRAVEPPTRRELLRNASCGFGMLALAGLCREAAAAGEPLRGPLAP